MLEPTLEPAPGSARIGSAYYPMLLTVFTALVLISNIMATKGVAFGPILTDGAFLLFPLTYVIGDVLAEVYGFAASTRAVIVAFSMQALAVAALWFTVKLPGVEDYPELPVLVDRIWSLAIAGLAGFLVGQLVNAWVVVRIKERTKEQHLWARLFGSSVVGQFADTVVFCAIAAQIIGFDSIRDSAVYIAIGWVWKMLVEAAMLPVTVRVIAAIKRREPSYVPAV